MVAGQWPTYLEGIHRQAETNLVDGVWVCHHAGEAKLGEKLM